MFGTTASAAAEAVQDRDAFFDEPFFLAHDHWTHKQMLSSSRVPPHLPPAGSSPGREATSVDF